MTLREKLTSLDEQLSYALFKRVPKTKRWRNILKLFEYSCHGLVFFVITIIAIYLFPANQKMLSHLFAGLCIDVFYVALTKAFARRRRPSYALQTDSFMMILSDKHSFPSGHATRAVFVACFVSGQMNSQLLSILVTLWSASVCLSRVMLGRHYLFDVAVGCVLALVHYWLQFGPLSFINQLSEWIVLTALAARLGSPNDTDDAVIFGDE
jgi:membrane-associated phospholipid phosphatase